MPSYLTGPQNDKNEKRTSLYPSYMDKYNRQRAQNKQTKKSNSYETISDMSFNEEPEELKKYDEQIQDMENKVNEYSKDNNENNMPYEKTTETLITVRRIERESPTGEKQKIEESEEKVVEHVTYGKDKYKLKDGNSFDDNSSKMKSQNKDEEFEQNNSEKLTKFSRSDVGEKNKTTPHSTYIVNYHNNNHNNYYYDKWSNLIESTDKVQSKIKNKFLISIASIFIIICSAWLLLNSFNEKSDNITSNQITANNQIMQEVIYAPTNKRETLDFVHSLANSLIIAEDGNMKWGRREVTPQNIRIAKESVKNFMNSDTELLEMLNQWEEGNFDNSVEVHNYVWRMLDGTMGYATDLDTGYIESITKTYFNK